MLFCSFFRGEVFQNHFEPGVYICAKCGYELFPGRSNKIIHSDSVAKRPEHNRPEVLKVSCGKCGNALSHESLNHGPKLSSLKFVPKGKETSASKGH
ncbi:hypothetical protein H8958_019143 [Nasalis larvatus]